MTIISGRYCGSKEHLVGHRAMLLANIKTALSDDCGHEETILAQWDDLELWIEAIRDTGDGWEAHKFSEFDEFRYETFEDDSLEEA